MYYDAAYIEYGEGNLLDYLRQHYDAAYIEYGEGNLLDYLRQYDAAYIEYEGNLLDYLRQHYMLLTQNMVRETCQTTSDNVYDAAYIEYVEGNLLDYLRQCI